ncbi:unnamed protein product [Linum tenue]|uniref:F-box domain-containing protein n=1 Tax=Linum tenue TaxID=586396 RepID=A0AAV0JH73_9ROSI|nr:unnamed protein product [Linum tenue]
MTELGQANGKRSRKEEDATADRLSHLPDSIIHHILSLLDDTKSAVQTCILSQLWRSFWKHVLVLTLHRLSFQKYSSFCRYVDEVLSLRNPLINARKIIYTDKERYENRDRRLLIRVIQYAASHGTQLLVLDEDTVLASSVEEDFRFPQFFAPILNSNLKTLEFRGYMVLNSGMGSPGFRNVTTLDLDRCVLYSDAEEEWDPDPFSNFPCLENLVLKDCYYGSTFYSGNRTLRISGLSLLSLKLVDMDDGSSIEIFAPRLKFFSLSSQGPFKVFKGIKVPSLEHSYIKAYNFFHDKGGRKELVQRHLISLFQALSNAKALTLHSWTISVLTEFYELLEQPSPFKRLESLIVDGDSIPCKLIGYFLKGDMKIGHHPGLSILTKCHLALAHPEELSHYEEEEVEGK